MDHQRRNERAKERKSILEIFDRDLRAYKLQKTMHIASAIVCYVLDQEMLLDMAKELTWLDVPAEKKFFRFLTTEAKKTLGAEMYKVFLENRRQDTIPY